MLCNSWGSLPHGLCTEKKKTKELYLIGPQFGHSPVSVNRVVDHAQVRFVKQFPDVFRKVSELEKRIVIRSQLLLRVEMAS